MISGNTQKLERSLALLLQYGTLCASVLMGAGVLSGVAHFGAATNVAASLMTVGVGLVILLPVCRLLLMTLMCAVAGEYCFAGIAAVVLTILAISCIVGLKIGVVSA